MTKERIVKELSKVREQLAGLQARERDLAEQLQMAEDAEKMKFIEKNKISLDRLILLNKVSEEEIMRLLKEKEQKEAAQSEEREAYSHEEQEVIIQGGHISGIIRCVIYHACGGIFREWKLRTQCFCRRNKRNRRIQTGGKYGADTRRK